MVIRAWSASELDRPIAGGERWALIFDKIQERQDGRQLAGGDHRVGALEGNPRTGADKASRSRRAGWRRNPLATREPDILFSIKPARSDRSRPEHSAHPSDLPASAFLLGRRTIGVRAAVTHPPGLGDGRLVKRPKRRDVRIVTGGDLGRMADGEAGNMAFGLDGTTTPYGSCGDWERRRRSGRPSSSTMACRRVQASTSVCGCRMPAVNAPAPTVNPKALAGMVATSPRPSSRSVAGSGLQACSNLRREPGDAYTRHRATALEKCDLDCAVRRI